MSEKKLSIAELLKDVAVVLLLVALVCLCTIYMLSYQTVGGYAFTRQTMATLSGESVKYQYADYFESSYACPRFVGFAARELGENVGFHCLGGENASVSATLVPFYEKLFGEDGSVVKLTPGAGEALFAELLARDHIYVAYENDLPKSLILALAMQDATVREITGEYIREILIVPELHLYNGVSMMPAGVQIYTEIYTFYAVARDSAGNYYRYATAYVPEAATDVSFNTNYYLTYTTTDSFFFYEYAELLATDTYFDTYDLHGRVSDTTTVLTAAHGTLPPKTLTMSYVSPTQTQRAALLDALRINPNKVTSFTDSSGVSFYYDEGCNAGITPRGLLTYTAHVDGGLSLSSLFEYRAQENTYDAHDYVGAALVLASDLWQAFYAADGHGLEMYISRVDYDGETTTVYFGYTSDGLPVYFEGSADLISFAFSDGRLRAVSCQFLAIDVAHRMPVPSDTLWDLRVAVMENKTRTAYAYAYYLYDGEPSGAMTVGRRTEGAS
ncbi:MAG: hypothetical protein IJV98_01530 [Clostridia bacterium]|nr:hypothetical protein [Clostridia bacterium]